MATVKRGKALVAQLRAQAGVRDPEALAAYLGRYKKARRSGLKPEQAKKVAGSGATEAKSSSSDASGAKANAKAKIQSQVSNLKKELPMVEISEVRPTRKGDEISPTAHMGHNAGRIVFNEKKMDARGIKEIRDQQKTGYIVKTDGDPLEYVATHEFGHSVPDAINKGASDPDTFEAYQEARDLYAKALRSDAKPPSFYSKTNRKEAFAEAFADYMLNPPEKHSPLTKEVGKVVEALKRANKKK